MDALEALGDGHAHAQQHGALGRPVAGRARAVHLARQHRCRGACRAVMLSRIVQRCDLARGEVAGPAALAAVGQLVRQLHIGERAAHHHLVVAAAAAVGVEVGRSHAMGLQVLGRRHIQRDSTSRGDVVGGDEVAEVPEHPGALDGSLAHHRAAHAVEVRRPAHVGRCLVPSERVARLGAQGLPGGVALEHARRALLVQVGGHVLAPQRGHFGLVGHDIGEVHRIPGAIHAKSILLQINIHGAGNGVGNHVGRLHQVVLRHIRRDAALEVAVARQHACQLDIVGDGVHLFHERAGVADAAHATEAAGEKAQLAQGLG